MDKFDYSTIQGYIDDIYESQWFQPNACYPVTMFYTNSSISDKDHTVDSFLRMHTNNTKKKNATYKLDSQDSQDLIAPKDLASYMEEEKLISTSGVVAKTEVLAKFVKVSGLQNPSIPITKNNGALSAGTSDSKAPDIKIEFLCDRELKVLNFLHAWQSKWYNCDWQKKTFVDKSSDKTKQGGEGFLGIANCKISTDGKVSVLSHLSLFGLIPKEISSPIELGPQVTQSGLPKITVTCTCAHAVLVYEAKKVSEKRLNYYFYK